MSKAILAECFLSKWAQDGAGERLLAGRCLEVALLFISYQEGGFDQCSPSQPRDYFLFVGACSLPLGAPWQEDSLQTNPCISYYHSGYDPQSLSSCVLPLLMLQAN